MSKSRIPNDDQQLDVTFIAYKQIDGKPSGLTSEERNQVIKALIDNYDGVQDHVTGIVVLAAPPLDGLPSNFVVQLWIHDWED